MLRLGPEWLSILSLEGLGLSVRDPSHVPLSRSDEITHFIVVESRTQLISNTAGWREAHAMDVCHVSIVQVRPRDCTKGPSKVDPQMFLAAN